MSLGEGQRGEHYILGLHEVLIYCCRPTADVAHDGLSPGGCIGKMLCLDWALYFWVAWGRAAVLD